MPTLVRGGGFDSLPAVLCCFVSVFIVVLYHQDHNSTLTNRIKRLNTISYKRRVPHEIFAFPVISWRSARVALSNSVTTTNSRCGRPFAGRVPTGEIEMTFPLKLRFR